MDKPPSTKLAYSPPRASLLSNFMWMTAGNATVKPLWFLFVTALCMRVLGPAAYGIFTSVLALAMILTLLGDLGTTAWATREVARAHESASSYLTNLFVGRLSIEVVVICTAPLIAMLLGYDRATTLALVAACLYAAGLKLILLPRVAFRAFEVFRYEAISIVAERTLVIAGGTTGLLTTRTPEGALFGMAAGMGLAVLLNSLWVHKRLVPFQPNLFDLRFLYRVHRNALPLGTYVLLAIVYGRVAPILLVQLEGEVTAGLYGVAARVLELLTALPLILNQVLLPRLTALHKDGDSEALYRLIDWGLFLGMGGAICVAAIFTFLGPTIIHLLDPNPAYAPAGQLLRVLIWVLPLITGTMVLTQAMIAAAELRFIAVLMTGALLLFLVLNILLIPHFSYYGTTAGLLVCQAIVFVGMLLRLRRHRGRPKYASISLSSGTCSYVQPEGSL